MRHAAAGVALVPNTGSLFFGQARTLTVCLQERRNQDITIEDTLKYVIKDNIDRRPNLFKAFSPHCPGDDTRTEDKLLD